MKDVRSRGWCFTINDYVDDDIAMCMSLYEDDDECKYVIIGFEKGLKNDKHHIQGYVYYNTQRKWSKMKAKHSTWHIEAQASDKNVNAYCYCMKDGDYYEIGERPRQGNRTDLEVIKNDMKYKKKTLYQVADDYFSQWCQYRKPFEEYRRMYVKHDTEMISYKDDDISMIYEQDEDLTDILIIKKYDKESIYHELMHIYYSKVYRKIYIPYEVYNNYNASLYVICKYIKSDLNVDARL